MRKAILLIFVTLLISSCVPIRIAPSISDYKLTTGKHFKKGLPKKTNFIFEDPKEAGEFYNYVNTKFNLLDYFVDTEVPFEIDDKEYFFSFYEVQIDDKALNLFPLAIDVALSASLGADSVEPFVSQNSDPILRNGNWYIAIEVFTLTEEDCLDKDVVSRDVVLPYLRALKEEYLSTSNYNEAIFKN